MIRRLVVPILAILLSAIATSAQTVAGIERQIERLEVQRARLTAGEANVEGYALYGRQVPARHLVGDPLEDQFVSAAARMEVLRHQILGLREIRAWLADHGGGEPVGEPVGAPPPFALTIGAAADANVYAYAYRNWNRANLGAHTQMEAGYHPEGGEKRAYLRFELFDTGPVDRAVLRIHHSGTAGSTGMVLGVHRVRGPWREGADVYHSGRVERNASPGELSWEQQPAFEPSPIATFRPSATPAWVEMDVTSLVNAWLTGTPNHGLVIKGVPPLTGPTWYVFQTREDPGGRGPRLSLYRGAIE